MPPALASGRIGHGHRSCIRYPARGRVGLDQSSYKTLLAKVLDIHKGTVGLATAMGPGLEVVHVPQRAVLVGKPDEPSHQDQ